jgi:hypothetical protein
LLGLIFVNFGPLKTLPNVYPPKSVAIQIKKTIKKKIKFSSELIVLVLYIVKKDNVKKNSPETN